MIIVWRVTERCNLRCPFCAYDRTLLRPRRQADPAMIRRFGTLLADYQRQTGDPVLVSWLGGEPLLWPEWRPLVEEYAHLGLRQSVTTNGTALSMAEMRRPVLTHLAELTISVDAVGSTHDELRGWDGGYAALREIVQALVTEMPAVRPASLPPLLLRANVVLMRHTIAGFAELCGELAAWGIREITFNQLGGADRPEYYPAHRLRPEQVEQLGEDLPYLRAHLAQQGVRLAGGEEYLVRFAATARGEALPVADCRPGERFLFLSETGLASPCSFTDAIPGVPLVELDSVLAILGLPLRFAQMRRAHPPRACEDCQSTQVFAKFAA